MAKKEFPTPKPGSRPKLEKSPRKITVTATSSYPKQLVQGSMATQSKIVEKKPAKKPSTKYSPAPMSAAAKAKTRVAAAKKQPSLTSKVVNRAKTVAREVRDIPTAVGTLATANKNKEVRSAAKSNLQIQIRDLAKAAKGRKGVRSAQTVRGGQAIRSVSSKKK